MKTTYTVTVTPKFPGWNNKPFTVEVEAASKSEANKRARRDLETQGYIFTHSDAATFSAKQEN